MCFLETLPCLEGKKIMEWNGNIRPFVSRPILDNSLNFLYNYNYDQYPGKYIGGGGGIIYLFIDYISFLEATYHVSIHSCFFVCVCFSFT